MRRIAIIGSGQAGLLAAHGLLRQGHDVTLHSDRSAEEWLWRSRPTGTAARFELALAYERELGLNHWEPYAPKGRGVHLTFCPTTRNRLVTLAGRLNGSYFQAVDLRLQSHRWMNDLAARGGRVLVEKVDVGRLDAIAAGNDLVLVASGRGPLAELFARNVARSVYDGPRRKLAMVIVTGAAQAIDGVPFLPVKFNFFAQHGEAFWVPYFHRDHGATWCLLFEAKAGGPMDRFDACGSGAEVLKSAKEVIRELMPWDWPWAEKMELADAQGWLTGGVAPTVREPVGVLPSGRAVMPIGDTAVSLDPIAGQGANHGNKMVRHVVEAVARRADGPFDPSWMRQTFEEFWADHGAATVRFNNLLLEPLSAAARTLLISQSGSDGESETPAQRIADAVVENFVDPRRITDAFLEPARARALVSQLAAGSWRAAFAKGALRVARGQLRRLLLLSLVIGGAGFAGDGRSANARSIGAQAASAKGQKVTRYTYLLAHGAIGTESSAINAGGSLQIHFEFHDRGRSAEIDEKIVAGRDHLPSAIEISGHGEQDAPATEHFSLVGGVAAWENPAEKGSKQVPGKAFYVSAGATAGETALLARALLAAPGHELALLPEGKAFIERRGSLKVSRNGESKLVTQYAITGLGFSPSPIWLTSEKALFGLVSIDNSTIAEGWEAALPLLLLQQEQHEHLRLAGLAPRLTHRPGKPVAFVHANLFDSKQARVSSNRTVLIDGNRITAVGLDGDIPLPEGAHIIDAAGQTLMPGLWDMHAHLQPEDGLLYLACGVTSVRDLGNDAEALARLVDRFDRGVEIGPRAVMAGFVNGRGAVKDPARVHADTSEEARAAVQGFARRGYLQIKVYSSLKPDLLPGIVEQAHSLGLRVSGHVPAEMSTAEFVNAGVDEIQHLNFLFLDFLPRRGHKLFTELSREVAAHGAEVDLQAEPMRAFVQLLKDRRVVVDPTVNLFEWLFENRDGAVAPGYAAVADSMPPQVRRGFLHGGLPVPPGMDRTYRDSFERMLELIKLLHGQGVQLVAGTDGQVDGFTLHRELELYERAGIPAPEVLRMATYGAARLAKRDRELGSIERGMLADLLLVEGNPALRISDLRRVKTVVKDGALLDAAELKGALGILPATYPD